ncbi:MAG: adenylate/guanylate cyclase domain-containing protein [Spirochaetaceae bacterium]|jgi:adenylate cyclase|nr:adenylate/guanylate cyclase domain-containing protein [Spirochaetaceae bacterium]
MSGTDSPIKPAKKTESTGEKLPWFIILVCVSSIILTLVTAGKLLYDKTLETAEAETVYINREAAAALDLFFSGLKSASTVLIETANMAGFNTVAGRGAVKSFFENNQRVVAVAFYDSPDKNAPPMSFVNHVFFNNNSIDERLVNIFVELNRAATEGARQTRGAILNCESIFGFPLLAMVFSYRRSGAEFVFFYPVDLAEMFKTAPRANRLVNEAGGVLLSSGRPLQPGGENISSRQYIRTMLSNPLDSGRLRYVNDEGRHTAAAYSKLNVVPALFITEITYDTVFGDLAWIAFRVVLVAAVLVVFFVFIVLFCTRSIRISLKKLTELDEVKRKFETTSRFADMSLARMSLDGLLPSGAEYKNAAVLLSGIESFARITERLNPDETVTLLNSYINRASGIVKKTNGTLDQFSDGNIRAYWGALSSSGSLEHDALNCVRCALMLRVAVYELNKERPPSAELPCMKLSCGISSGEFTAGIADCGGREAYTLIGESGVLAETLKAQNILCDTDILISENTWQLVQKFILVHEMRPLRIEGRAKPLRLFALINLRTKQGEAQVFPATLQDVRSLYLPVQAS